MVTPNAIHTFILISISELPSNWHRRALFFWTSIDQSFYPGLSDPRGQGDAMDF
jgi:hypothetical protein